MITFMKTKTKIARGILFIFAIVAISFLCILGYIALSGAIKKDFTGVLLIFCMFLMGSIILWAVGNANES